LYFSGIGSLGINCKRFLVAEQVAKVVEVVMGNLALGDVDLLPLGNEPLGVDRIGGHGYGRGR
jgi:hypothetical protein